MISSLEGGFSRTSDKGIGRTYRYSVDDGYPRFYCDMTSTEDDSDYANRLCQALRIKGGVTYVDMTSDTFVIFGGYTRFRYKIRGTLDTSRGKPTTLAVLQVATVMAEIETTGKVLRNR